MPDDRDFLPSQPGLPPVAPSGMVVLFGLHVRDPIERATKFRPVEKSGARFDKLAARHAIREKNRYELIHRDMVLLGQLGGLVVEVFSQGDTLIHLPLPSILLRNSRGVITGMPNRSAPAKCLTLYVTIAFA